MLAKAHRRSLPCETRRLRARPSGNVVQKAQGKIDLAIAHYAEALRLDPDHPGARFNLNRALAARGTAAAGGSGLSR